MKFFSKSISKSTLALVFAAERALNKLDPYSTVSKSEAHIVLQAILELHKQTSNDVYLDKCINILRTVWPRGILKGTYQENLGTLSEAVKDCHAKINREDLRADQAHAFVYSLRFLLEHARFGVFVRLDDTLARLRPALYAYSQLKAQPGRV